MMEKLLKNKIKTRELTRNEKFLLGILGILLILLGGYRYIITPQTKTIETLKAQRLDYESKIEENNDFIRREESIQEEWNRLNKEKETLYTKYFSTLNQSEIIYLLNDIIPNQEVFTEDLSFSRPVYEEMEDFQIKNMDISLPYKGEYTGIIEIIRALKNSPQKLSLESVSIDMDSDGSLNGNMAIKVYSLDGIDGNISKPLFTDDVERKNLNEDNEDISMIPFFENKVENENRDGQDYTKSTVKPYIEETLLDFETKNIYLIPSQKLVQGNVSISKKAKSKKYALRLEYNILAVEEENRVYVDVSKNNVILKYPPNTLGIWVYAYDYSPATIGMLFRGQMGEEIYIPFTEGIGWTGWRYLEAPPHEDLKIYPLTLEKLYVEIPSGREDYGVLIMDQLEAVYTRNIDEKGNDISGEQYMFHVVEQGDTIEKISVKYYQSNRYKNEILKLNDLNEGEIISIGRILVLKRR